MKALRDMSLTFSESHIGLLTKIVSEKTCGKRPRVASAWFQEAVGLWWRGCLEFEETTKDDPVERLVHITERGEYVLEKALAEQRLEFQISEVHPYRSTR